MIGRDSLFWAGSQCPCKLQKDWSWNLYWKETVIFLVVRDVWWWGNYVILSVTQVLRYEAVHSMSGWEDLKRRLAPDRRCYIYTHRSMPGEPVVVLHTALEYEIADNIQVGCRSEKVWKKVWILFTKIQKDSVCSYLTRTEAFHS